MKKYLLPIGIIALVICIVGVGVFLSKMEEDSPGTVLSARIEAGEHVLGNPEASVQLIEYADMQCPACASFDPVVKKLMEENSDWVYFSYRHLPLNAIHRNAEEGSYAIEAAEKQGKFWEMKEIIYGRQADWASLGDPLSKFLEYAKELGMDQDKFLADFHSDEVKTKVDSDLLTAEQSGFNSTPTFVVNGEKIQTPANYEQFVQLLQSKRAQ